MFMCKQNEHSQATSIMKKENGKILINQITKKYGGDSK